MESEIKVALLHRDIFYLFLLSCILQKNQTLEVLDVSWNGFGERGMKELQNSLKINKRLRVLDLR